MALSSVAGAGAAVFHHAATPAYLVPMLSSIARSRPRLRRVGPPAALVLRSSARSYRFGVWSWHYDSRRACGSKTSGGRRGRPCPPGPRPDDDEVSARSPRRHFGPRRLPWEPYQVDMGDRMKRLVGDYWVHWRQMGGGMWPPEGSDKEATSSSRHLGGQGDSGARHGDGRGSRTDREAGTPKPDRNGGRQRSFDNPTGVRPGRGIEDVERGALETFLDGMWKGIQEAKADAPRRPTPASDDSWPSRKLGDNAAKTPDNSTSQDQWPSSRLGEDVVEYEIDPITNKKVPKGRIQASDPSLNYETVIPIEPPTSRAVSGGRHFGGMMPPESEPSLKSTPEEDGFNPVQETEPVSDDALGIHTGGSTDPAVSSTIADSEASKTNSSWETGTTQARKSRKKLEDVWSPRGRWRHAFGDVSTEATAAERAEDLDILRPSDIRSRTAAWERAASEPVPDRRELDQSQQEQSAQADVEDASAKESLQGFTRSIGEMERTDGAKAKARDGPLTGYHLRDFPDGYRQKWTNGPATDGDVTLLPSEEAAGERERMVQQEKTFAEAMPSNPADKVEPALSRQRGPRPVAPRNDVADKVAKEAASQAHLTASDLIKEIRAIYEEQYGPLDAQVRAAAAKPEPVVEPPASGEHPGPSIPSAGAAPAASGLTGATSTEQAEVTQYKILAYDPTMQTVLAADTASATPDASPPLPPAEVLLRLSNPAKFFAHFAPLQREGYEIVSGSGDVLVFRKVRDGVVLPAPSTAPVHPQPSGPSSPSSSLLGSSGDVSGTEGQGGAEKAPRFVSGIDVRREEPVFSGARLGEPRRGRYGEEDAGYSSGRGQEKDQKKTSLGKRLVIGAAWMGGLAYALGVVGEHFASGGGGDAESEVPKGRKRG